MRRPVAAPPADGQRLVERRHPSNEPEYRSEAQRDRDRILYSSALLRLGQVTQVASPEVGHIFHSRLTHSLKVGQVARRLAERLIGWADHHDARVRPTIVALEADAVEAAALAHDLGHPPFGHLAEEELDRHAHAIGGFEGNAQSFRILTRLSVRTVDHPGLNLTRQTLNGALKYPWLRDVEHRKRSEKWGAYDADREYFDWARQNLEPDTPTLEARITDWADDVTYAVHDMDDFYRADLIPLDRLAGVSQELDAFRRYVQDKEPDRREVMDAAVERVFTSLPVLPRYEGKVDERANLRALGSFLITRYIKAFRVVASDSDDVEVDIDDLIEQEVAVLKWLTWFYIIERPSLALLQRGQRAVVSGLVEMYNGSIDDDRRVFPPAFAQRLDAAETEDARKRVVIDLVAGMTEASALEVYRRAIGAVPGSLLSGPQV